MRRGRVATVAALAAALIAGAAAARGGAPAEDAASMLHAAAWMQTAEEYRAQVLQTFRAAGAALPQARTLRPAATEQWDDAQAAGKPPAVVLDVDETVLDNLAFSVGLARDGRTFDEQAARDWHRWVLAGQAPALPGAADFVSRARSLGLRVVFVTNRECARQGPWDAQGRSADCPQKEATRRNLEQALGQTVAPQDLMLRFERRGRDDRDKRARRAEVAQSHRIVMLVGDDLHDFVRREDYRDDRHGALWGAQWFVLANPLYGSWENGLADAPSKRAALRPWRPPAERGALLRVMSWNLEWLADARQLQRAGYWHACRNRDRATDPAIDGERGGRAEARASRLPPCDAYRRAGLDDARDYRERKLAGLRERLRAADAEGLDVLAVQEVHDAQALRAVLPPGWTVACVSEGPHTQRLAFALRGGSPGSARCEPVPAIAAGVDALRPGLVLRLDTPQGPLALLNLHLKAGCAHGPIDPARPDCARLQQQVLALEDWVETTAAAGGSWVLLGDFNRDLGAERRGAHPARHDRGDPRSPARAEGVRNLWGEVDDGEPAASRMTLAEPDAEGRACRHALDHLAVGGGRWTIASAHREPAERALSDHCALRVELRAR